MPNTILFLHFHAYYFEFNKIAEYKADILANLISQRRGCRRFVCRIADSIRLCDSHRAFRIVFCAIDFDFDFGIKNYLHLTYLTYLIVL